jgi:hypothetical protein
MCSSAPRLKVLVFIDDFRGGRTDSFEKYVHPWWEAIELRRALAANRPY